MTSSNGLYIAVSIALLSLGFIIHLLNEGPLQDPPHFGQSPLGNFYLSRHGHLKISSTNGKTKVDVHHVYLHPSFNCSTHFFLTKFWSLWGQHQFQPLTKIVAIESTHNWHLYTFAAPILHSIQFFTQFNSSFKPFHLQPKCIFRPVLTSAKYILACAGQVGLVCCRSIWYIFSGIKIFVSWKYLVFGGNPNYLLDITSISSWTTHLKSKW